MEEKKRLNSACISCIAKNHMEKYPENISEEEQIFYKQRLFRLLAESKTTDSAPLIVKKIDDLRKELFGKGTDYTKIKQYFNQYVLNKLPKLEAEIARAEDPLYRALQYSMTGNYIDFGAMENVEEQKFEELLSDAEKISFDRREMDQLRKDLETGKRLVFLTDNCGEVVFDLALIKTLKTLYPKLFITAIVRGEPVLNDATIEDAKQIGLQNIVPVIENGSAIAGTSLDDISKEALEAIESADLLISKGQGNFETLYGCGKNIYYLFMCKCSMFAERFHKKVYEGMLLNDKFI